MSQNESNIVYSKYEKIDFPNISIGEYIYNKLKELKDKIIIIDAQTGESLTANDIINRTQTIAVSLLKYGITKSDVILFNSVNSVPYAVTQIVAYFLGLIISPTKPSHNVFEVKNQIDDCGATIIFTSLANASITKDAIKEIKNPKQVKHVFVFDGDYEGFIPYQTLINENLDEKLSQIPYFPIDPKNDIAYIFYTSGTTGLPKGAMTTNYAFVAACITYEKVKVFPDYSIFCGHYPLGHIGGTMFFTLLLSVGRYIVFGSTKFTDILMGISKYKITDLGLFPAMGKALIDINTDQFDLSSVKVMLTGGSAFPGNVAKELIKKYNLKQFVEFYAMTETMGSVISLHYPSDKYIPGAVGTIGPNMEMKIIDLKTGNSLPANENGEICLRGPLMFKGYLNNPKATASTIDEHGWLHTGDVGHYDENGHLFIVDRIKELVKFQMFTVFPTEVEDCLLNHDAISETVVIGVKHVTDGEWLRAYVVLKKGKEISGEEIVKYVSDRMAFQKQLRAGVVFVDHIPRTIVGKADRQYFKKMCVNEILK